ncbi:hypothetical protein RR46_04289 [Papilio xuthus]|uniref:Uncharacterized protein n=1 Tax=Papilio xuthus TaxID=66420 RepID=A0A194QDX7_PAPXU|nr:hypothetical protein RR46_04289 [Papilio xuthus]
MDYLGDKEEYNERSGEGTPLGDSNVWSHSNTAQKVEDDTKKTKHIILRREPTLPEYRGNTTSITISTLTYVVEPALTSSHELARPVKYHDHTEDRRQVEAIPRFV